MGSQNAIRAGIRRPPEWQSGHKSGTNELSTPSFPKRARRRRRRRPDAKLAIGPARAIGLTLNGESASLARWRVYWPGVNTTARLTPFRVAIAAI
jgi:hypothetical protein